MTRPESVPAPAQTPVGRLALGISHPSEASGRRAETRINRATSD